MACENNELLLRAYFDGELDAVRSVEFEKHLKTCDAVRAGVARTPSHARLIASGKSLRARAGSSATQKYEPRFPQWHDRDPFPLGVAQCSSGLQLPRRS